MRMRRDDRKLNVSSGTFRCQVSLNRGSKTGLRMLSAGLVSTTTIFVTSRVYRTVADIADYRDFITRYICTEKFYRTSHE